MKKIKLIGNSHIDPVWLWQRRDGYSEVLATFRSALDRMLEFDDFKYTSSSSIFYEWVEETSPEMFEEIKKRVNDGRWELVGGWLIEPDCNIPCGESFARHALYGQSYFKDKFGVTADTGYNVDSFGHNASLPKILKASGISKYVFMRPMENEMNLPAPLFKWQSADGSEVLTYRLPKSYSLRCGTLHSLDEIATECQADGMPRMAFYGVGNHGGGPTHEIIKEIRNEKMHIADFSTVKEYFDEADIEAIPTVKGELQHHARGCYSVNAVIKEMNRRCEENLLEAERFALMASHLTGYKYPKEKFTAAWKKLLFNQFHDILAGCAIKSAYRDASYDLGEVMSTTEDIINSATQIIAMNINTGNPKYYTKKPKSWLVWESEKLGMPIIVFNSKPFPVKDIVKLKISAKRITDEYGSEIPFQQVRGEQTFINYTYEICIPVEVPALGYRVYRVFQEGEYKQAYPEIVCNEATLENELMRVNFSEITGEIESIVDKTTNEYILNNSTKAILLDETLCDTWGHGCTTLGECVGEFSSPEFEVLEKGAVLSTLKVTQRSGNSKLTREYTLRKNSDVIYVKGSAENTEKHRTLKLTFPIDKKLTVEVPYGTVERELNGGEEPFGKWFASGKLAVANTGKHGYDTTDDSIRMTVLRTAIYADHFGNNGSNSRDGRSEYMDTLCSEFEYTIFKNSTNAENQKNAELLHTPPRAINGSYHTGKLPECYSGFACESENIIFPALKRSENGKTNIIRFFEANGKDTSSAFTLLGKKINLSIKAFGLNTVDDGGNELLLTEFPF